MIMQMMDGDGPIKRRPPGKGGCVDMVCIAKRQPMESDRTAASASWMKRRTWLTGCCRSVQVASHEGLTGVLRRGGRGGSRDWTINTRVGYTSIGLPLGARAGTGRLDEVEWVYETEYDGHAVERLQTNIETGCRTKACVLRDWGAWVPRSPAPLGDPGAPSEGPMTTVDTLDNFPASCQGEVSDGAGSAGPGEDGNDNTHTASSTSMLPTSNTSTGTQPALAIDGSPTRIHPPRPPRPDEFMAHG